MNGVEKIDSYFNTRGAYSSVDVQIYTFNSSKEHIQSI